MQCPDNSGVPLLCECGDVVISMADKRHGADDPTNSIKAPRSESVISFREDSHFINYQVYGDVVILTSG